MLLAELGLATRREIALEETPDEGSPGVPDKVTPGDVVVSQVVKTVRVHSGFEDADRRFLPNFTAAVASIGKPTTQTEELSRGRPGNDTDPGNCMGFRNLPPQYWCQQHHYCARVTSGRRHTGEERREALPESQRHEDMRQMAFFLKLLAIWGQPCRATRASRKK